MIALLAVALAVGVFAEPLRLPYSVMLLLAGVPLKLPHATELFGPTLLFVYFPALVFEAAWNIDVALPNAIASETLVVAVGGSALGLIAAVVVSALITRALPRSAAFAPLSEASVVRSVTCLDADSATRLPIESRAESCSPSGGV